jgi:hypothetical protein
MSESLKIKEIIEKRKNGYVLSTNEIKILGQYCAKIECQQCYFKKKYGKCPIKINLQKGGFIIEGFG